jgi:hypothetical protein
MAPRDLLDYYLGPTGIPDRLRALNELNPVAGIMRGMSAAGRAADSDRPAAERRSALGEATMETGIALLPVGLGRLASLFRVPKATAAASMADEAADAVETLTAYRPEATPTMTAEEMIAEIDRDPEPFRQTPFVFDPDDVPDPTIEELAAGADDWPFTMEDTVDAGPNPWTNVEGAEDLAAAYVPPDPFSSPYGVPRPDLDGQGSLFSPATRAAVSLEQPRYGSVDEVISNLRRQGATSMEIDLLRDQGVFDSLEAEADFTGSISKDSVIEFVGNAPRLNRSDFTPDQGARYERYFPPGAENYRESVFSFGQQPRAYGGLYYQSHFEEVPNAVFHMRTGEFPTAEGGRAFHVGEIQSDLGKELRGITQDERDFNRPLNMSPLEWRISVLQRIGDKEEELLGLDNQLEDLRLNFDGVDPQEIDNLRLIRLTLENSIARDRDILRQITEEGDVVQTFGLSTYGSRFGNDDAAEIVSPIPIARDTNDYNTAAIARAFADATESGADFLTFNTGDMMHQFSGGRLEGQRKAYDDILPRNLQAYLQRLATEYDIEPPVIERFTIQGKNEDYTVPGVRLTPELKALVQTQGLPSYKNGGIVSLL